jgi:hypothetical protein
MTAAVPVPGLRPADARPRLRPHQYEFVLSSGV